MRAKVRMIHNLCMRVYVFVCMTEQTSCNWFEKKEKERERKTNVHLIDNCLPLANQDFDVASLNHGFAQSPWNPGWSGCVQYLAFQHYQMKLSVSRIYLGHGGILLELQSLHPLHDPKLKWLNFVQLHCKFMTQTRKQNNRQIFFISFPSTNFKIPMKSECKSLYFYMYGSFALCEWHKQNLHQSQIWLNFFMGAKKNQQKLKTQS